VGAVRCVLWPEKQLLFINGSTNAGEFKSPAQAVAGKDVVLIKGQEVFRSFAGVTRLRLNSVGLSEQLGRNVGFTSRMGADVAPVLADVQRKKARKSVLAPTGYEAGESATVAASRKGRIGRTIAIVSINLLSGASTWGRNSWTNDRSRRGAERHVRDKNRQDAARGHADQRRLARADLHKQRDAMVSVDRRL
jgi:hypothetical protein